MDPETMTPEERLFWLAEREALCINGHKTGIPKFPMLRRESAGEDGTMVTYSVDDTRATMEAILSQGYFVCVNKYSTGLYKVLIGKKYNWWEFEGKGKALNEALVLALARAEEQKEKP